MKICKECGHLKPLAQFYAHPYMQDGRLNSCKLCRRLYQRARAAAGYAAIIDRRRYENNPRRREALRIKSERWTKNNPEKRRAQAAVGNAIRAGRLVRLPCEVCGRWANAHHDDYARPLDVRWLCPRHHALWHRSTLVLAELDAVLQLTGARS